MTVSMQGKVALVTGAGSGIGRASALEFSAMGAKVLAIDISEGNGQETVNQIKLLGGEATFLRLDVSDSSQFSALEPAIMNAYGRLDFAHNNAGITGQGRSTHQITLDEWSNVMNVNLTGIWLSIKEEIPLMLKTGGGAIVNTSSGAGLVGIRGAAAYTASKHGVVGLTKAAALDYALTNGQNNDVAGLEIANSIQAAEANKTNAAWTGTSMSYAGGTLLNEAQRKYFANLNMDIKPV